MKRCILFLRVSTNKQELDSQESSLRNKAHKDGFTDEYIYVIKKKESAVKLSEEEREGLQELYQEIEKGDVDCIRIWELSRLSRNMEVLLSVRKKLLAHKVQLYCSNPEFTLFSEDRTKTNKMSELIFSIFGTFAEQEVVEKKERFARGKRAKAEQNKYTGGKLPFGYTVEEDTKKIIPEEIKEDGSEGDAVVVRNIFDMYENGMSQTAIAKYYYERGRTQISMSLVNNILTNESYTGKTTEEKIKHAKRHGKDSEWTAYPRSYPILITPEQFQRCRDIADTNNTKLSKARNIYFADMLFRCPQCGRKMQPVGNRGIYMCRDAHNINRIYSGARNGEQCDYRGNVSINAVDSLAWHSAMVWEMHRTAYQTEQQIKDLEAKIKDSQACLEGIDILRSGIAEKKERIGMTFVRGLLTQKRVDEELNLLKEEENTINRKEAEYVENIRKYSQLIATLKADGDLDKIFYRPESRKNDPDWTPTSGNINFEWKMDFYARISAIATDEEKYKICHKNIQSISVRDIFVKYKFKHRGLKIIKARYFTVIPTLLDTRTRHYVLISNTGNGGLLAWTNDIDDKRISDYYSNGFLDTSHSFREIEIVQRIRDEHKYNKRREERTERETNRIKEKGESLTVRELSALSGIPSPTIHSAIQRQSLCATKHGKEYWIEKKDADAYVNSKKQDK